MYYFCLHVFRVFLGFFFEFCISFLEKVPSHSVPFSIYIYIYILNPRLVFNAEA